MRNSLIKSKIVFVVLSLIVNSVVSAIPDYPAEVEISTKHEHIKVGEPLIIKATYRFEEPQVSKTNEFYQTMGSESIIQIKRDEAGILTPHYYDSVGPGTLFLQDTQGLVYACDSLLFYNPYENRLIFDKPGIYVVTVRRTREIISNPLYITVEPANDLNKRALSFLLDRNDYLFLEDGSNEDPNKRSVRIFRLRLVVEQCEGSIYAKWAAARLGLVYFEDFHKKHPSFIKFKAKLKKGKVKEPLFDKAHMYLATGAKLPDEFPIREKVLYQLVRTEVIKDNYKKAFSMLDELGAKYPKGKYGKRASRGKEELKRIKKREENQ
jgi:hypothetical protein